MTPNTAPVRPSSSGTTVPAALRARLAALQPPQDHVLASFDRLDEASQRALIAQIEGLDLASLPRLIAEYVRKRPQFPLPEQVAPAPYLSRDGKGHGTSGFGQVSAIAEAGRALIRAGKVAAFTVAGGQGSRLGYEGPKGCYAAGAVTGKTLFQIFAEALLGAKDRHGVEVPWYIMTSPLNHTATVEFFQSNKHFGLNAANIRFFQQGVLPSFCARTGRMLMSSPGEIATNPDGHGGSLKALHASGSLADMRSRGVEYISYFQIDNPIVNVLDPVFLGLHASREHSSAEMSSKMVPKASAGERVGVFCTSGTGARKGRIEVVEYSDLPAELSAATNPDGSLKFIAGSIAVHAMGVSFVEKLNTDSRFELPYHRADKKIPCCDPESGEPIQPTDNNGVKLERFVFDALPMCERSIVLETDRVEEFAPIKNATGSDSPESCAAIQTERAARWLERAGISVPRKPDGSPDCTLEISPRTASAAEELSSSGVNLPRAIERGARLAL